MSSKVNTTSILKGNEKLLKVSQTPPKTKMELFSQQIKPNFMGLFRNAGFSSGQAPTLESAVSSGATEKNGGDFLADLVSGFLYIVGGLALSPVWVPAKSAFDAISRSPVENIKIQRAIEKLDSLEQIQTENFSPKIKELAKLIVTMNPQSNASRELKNIIQHIDNDPNIINTFKSKLQEKNFNYPDLNKEVLVKIVIAMYLIDEKNNGKATHRAILEQLKID
jgi:hypothetical protein